MPDIDITKKYKTFDGRLVVSLSPCAGTFSYCGKVDGEIVYWTERGDDSRCRHTYRLKLAEEPVTIDPNKKYISNGQPVTFITTSGRGDWPFVGYVGKRDQVMQWGKEGRSNTHLYYNLEPVKEKKTGWFVEHAAIDRHGCIGKMFISEKDACDYSIDIGVKYIEVNWEE